MKKKILTIFVIMLFLPLIPSAVGKITDSESDIRTTDFDVSRTFYNGLVLFPRYSDDDLICFAIRLFYIEFSPTERSWGCIILSWITIEDFHGIINTGPFNIIGWI